MANLTGFFRSPAANVNVTFTDSSAAASCGITDLSKLVFEFDLVPDALEINRLSVLYNAVDISMYQYDSQGNDIYDRLVSSTSVPIQITANFWNGTVGRYQFRCTPSDIIVDELNKIVKVKARPALPSVTVGQVFANAEATDRFAYARTIAGAPPTIDKQFVCMSAGRFIRRALEEFDTVLNASVTPAPKTNNGFYGSYVFDDFGVEAFTANFAYTAFVVVNVNSTTIASVTLANGTALAPENVPALEVMKSLAALEGSLFGQATNTFYEYKLTTSNVTLSYSDTIDLKFEQGYEALQYIFEGIQSEWLNDVESLTNSSITRNLNPDAFKFARILINSQQPFLQKGQIVNAVTGSYGINVIDADFNDTTPINANIELNLVNVGAAAYAKSLPSGGIKIAGRVRGITKMPPNRSINFDSSVPDRYQNKTFRPTYLSYDFKTDEVEFKAYEI